LGGLGSLFLTACVAAPRGSNSGGAQAQRKVAAEPVCRPPVQTLARRQAGYGIVRRAAWGAESLKANHDPMEKITRITLHHTAELPSLTRRSDAEVVKGVQNFHRNQRGWADIGYHWLIGVDGNVYEGRLLNIQGAHAGGGNNKENLGISVMGNFTTGLPEARQLRTVEVFLDRQLARYGLPVDKLYGHRDFKATECPGDRLYAWLQAFKKARRRVAPEGSAGG